MSETTSIVHVGRNDMEAAVCAVETRWLPGWRLFPVQGKIPARGCRWKDESTADASRRAVIGQKYPHDGWAVHCGASGFLVVDLDEKNGVSGSHSWCALLEQAGVPDSQGNPRVIGSTPSGGRHLYYRAPLQSSEVLRPVVGILPGVDIRSGDSSAVVSGPRRSLTIIRDGREPFPEAPKALLSLLRARLSRQKSAYPSRVSPTRPNAAWVALEGACRAVARTGEGSRNEILNWAANGAGRRALASGYSVDSVEAVLLLAARDCGLPFHEASRSIGSGLSARNEAR